MFARDSSTVPRWRVPPVFGPRGSRSSSHSVIIIITDRLSYTVVDCRRPSFPGRCCSCLERSSTSRHVCAVPTSFSAVVWWLIFSTVPFPTFSTAYEVTRVITRHCNRLCYLLTYLLSGGLSFVGEDASRLQVLDCGNNNLSSIDVHSLHGLNSLIHLDLSGNSIVEVADGAFGGLSRLTRLDLRDNRLTRLTTSTFRGLTSLRYLLLTNNRITTIDRRTFRSLEALVYIVLKGNPIGSQPVRFQVPRRIA